MSSFYSYSSDEGRYDRRRRSPIPLVVEPRAGRVDRRERRKPKKKASKSGLPPQEEISRIWSKFSAQKFSKAMVILPPSNESTSHSPNIDHAPPPERNNILVSEDFERVAQECRRRVRKLVEECKRVNMRYRDPDFDIECDLELGKGYCLNGLGDHQFRVNQRMLSNPSLNIPRAAKRVGRIFEKPTFMKEVSPVDVNQGRLDNCWLMASLTSLASVEGGVQRLCVEYDSKVGIYGFVFHRDGEWITSIIDDKLHLKAPDWESPSVQRRLLEQTSPEEPEKEYQKTYQTGSQALYFAHCRNQNETWLPLLEKAYAKAHGDYGSLNGGWIGEGVEDLTGGITIELLTSDILDEDELWENEILKVNKEFLFGCSTGLMREEYGDRDGILEGHAYVIMEARQLSTGERLVKLRNPWGRGKKGNWEGPWSDGSKEFTPESQRELNHKFATDSVFWISYEDMLRKYQHLDRTRLFVDAPDWRITQKWISVDVPWKAQLEERFTIVLKKESPIVLVLSQLDDRYFDALRGQYTFRLHFQLHGANSIGDEDFIVRSHRNCLMERSAVIELKCLPAGTYSIFVKVTAVRDLKLPTVEEVVKAECRLKVNNEKLAQVAKTYDLAHGKAAAYMESNAKARKEHDKAKIRAERVAARRKHWERGHLVREAMRKQNKKNDAKWDEKDAKARAKARGNKGRIPRGVTDDRNFGPDRRDKAVPLRERAPRPNMADTLRGPDSQTPVLSTETSFQTEGMVASPSSESQEISDTPESDTMPTFPGPPGPQGPQGPRRTLGPPGPPGPALLRGVSTCSIPGPTGPGFLPGQHSPPLVEGRYPQPRPTGPLPVFRPMSPPRGYVPSEGESSATPVSDFEDAFSDYEPPVEPGRDNNRGVQRMDNRPGGVGSDCDDEPDPWNAVCIVGLRVYSKDEDLKVKISGQAFDDKVKNVPDDLDNGTAGDIEDEGEEVKKGLTEEVTAATIGPTKAKDDEKVADNTRVKELPTKGKEERYPPSSKEGVLTSPEEKATPASDDAAKLRGTATSGAKIVEGSSCT